MTNNAGSLADEHQCPSCGSTLDRREGPTGASYQCLDYGCGSTFAPDEIEAQPGEMDRASPSLDQGVTQEDRDAAALLGRELGWAPHVIQAVSDGGRDYWPTVRAFARHRQRFARQSPAPTPVGEVGELVERLRWLEDHTAGNMRQDYRQAADTIASLTAERDAALERCEVMRGIATYLTNQDDEPWPSGTESDRLHYWRDKAIEAARRLALGSGGGG